MAQLLIGSEYSSILNKSLFVTEKEYKDFNSSRRKEIIDNIFRNEDKITNFLDQVRDQLPNLIAFKNRENTDPLLLVDRFKLIPVITVDSNNLYVRQGTANAVMLFNFIKRYFKTKLPTGQIPIIAAAFTDLLVSMKVKPISDEILKESVLPELMVYVTYMFHNENITVDLVTRYYTQVSKVNSVKVKQLTDLISEYKKQNITSAKQLFPRVEKLIGLENLHQRLLMKYGINDVIFMFDQPFYLYTTFNLSLHFKVSPNFYQTIKEKTGKRIKSFIDILIS